MYKLPPVIWPMRPSIQGLLSLAAPRPTFEPFGPKYLVYKHYLATWQGSIVTVRSLVDEMRFSDARPFL
jgi:hypothetical protein